MLANRPIEKEFHYVLLHYIHFNLFHLFNSIIFMLFECIQISVLIFKLYAFMFIFGRKKVLLMSNLHIKGLAKIDSLANYSY